MEKTLILLIINMLLFDLKKLDMKLDIVSKLRHFIMIIVMNLDIVSKLKM